MQMLLIPRVSGMLPLYQIFYFCLFFPMRLALNFVNYQRHNALYKVSPNKHTVL